MTYSESRALDARIGANLRAARKTGALDLHLVMSATGRTAQDIAAIETGKIRLNAQEMTAFSKVLQVEIRTLFADTTETESLKCDKSIDRGDLLTNLIKQGRQNSTLANLVLAMRNDARSKTLDKHAA
ncbi:MAG: hypothetical protein AAFR51_17665 [Pseudomonadota bacterium]